MTSVCPALCPPWKRTTPCACSVSQSTTLPLPSSPHWVPMTTTFLLMRLAKPAGSQPCGELAQVERKAGRGTRAAESLADLVVAPAAADRIGLAGGEHREARAGLVVIAAQIGEIDVQRFDPWPRGLRERGERGQRAGDRGRIGQPRARRCEHFVRRPVQRRQRDECIAPRGGQASAVSSATAGTSLLRSATNSSLSLALPAMRAPFASARYTPTWPRSRCRPRTAAAASDDSSRPSTSRSALDARHRRRARRRSAGPRASAPARDRRAQHAAGVAQPGDAGLVEQMRIDARDLRRDVGAHAEQASGQLIDHLEGLQLEVVAGAGQQRIQILDQRRLHQSVAVLAEMVEQRAAQRLDPLRLGRQDVLDVFGQEPATHRCTGEEDGADSDGEQARRSASARRTARSGGGTCRARSRRQQRQQPSSTSTSAHAARNDSGTASGSLLGRRAAAQLLPPPDCFRYWKNSELGSSTIRRSCSGTSPCRPRGCGRTSRTRDSARRRARRSPRPSRRPRP